MKNINSTSSWMFVWIYHEYSNTTWPDQPKLFNATHHIQEPLYTNLCCGCWVSIGAGFVVVAESA